MLPRQHLRRYHKRSLQMIGRCHHKCEDRHDRLTGSDIPLYQPCHHRISLQLLLDGVPYPLLRTGKLIRQPPDQLLRLRGFFHMELVISTLSAFFQSAKLQKEIKKFIKYKPAPCQLQRLIRRWKMDLLDRKIILCQRILFPDRLRHCISQKLFIRNHLPYRFRDHLIGQSFDKRIVWQHCTDQSLILLRAKYRRLFQNEPLSLCLDSSAKHIEHAALQ